MSAREPRPASFPVLKERLKENLRKAPPGYDAQYRMAPPHRPGRELSIHPPGDAQEAAVLLLLYPHEGECYIPMMQRPPRSGPHSSQISFPGGKREDEDRDFLATALRESHEEFGIEPEHVEVLGGLSRLYIEPSHFLVYPFVGAVDARPAFRPDPVEVEALYEFRLRDFLRPRSRKHRLRRLRGMEIDMPYFEPQAGKEIWGASAMILSEFLACIEGWCTDR